MGDTATFAATLETSAGFCQHDYLPNGSNITERVIYSALPGIVLSTTEVDSKLGVVLVIDPACNTTVHADRVFVMGQIKAPGRRLKIVARKLIFVGEDAAIVTDGLAGSQPAVLQADPQPPAAASGARASVEGTPTSDGRMAPGGDGKRGWSPKDPDAAKEALVENGTSAGSGTSAGDIEIVVEKWVGKATLSAHGGDGGNGQDGQDGQDGGNGGDGAEAEGFTPAERPAIPRPWHVAMPPGKGGAGGDAGRGGAGGAGGDAGSVTVRWVRAVAAECATCAASLDCLECAACAKLGAPQVTIANAAGARGLDGKDGAVGIGGMSGETFDKELLKPGTLTFVGLAGARGELEHGSVVALRDREPELATKLLGAFGDGCYFYDESCDDHKQSWTIQRVNGAGKLRFGDKVRLANRSYSHYLIQWAGYLNTGRADETWTVENAADASSTAIVKWGDPLHLKHEGGRHVAGATKKGNTWYSPLAATMPPRIRAANGHVLDKPAGSDPWTTHEKGDDKPIVRQVMLSSDLCDHWQPAQVWLQLERLKGQYLTIDLGGAELAWFGSELLRWNLLLSPLATDLDSETDPPPRGVVPVGADPGVRAELRGALAKLSHMLGMYSQHYDYFGNSRNYAPNPAFQYYDKRLTIALAAFKQFEDHYLALRDQGLKDEAFKRSATAAFNEATATRDAAARLLEDARVDLTAAQRHMVETMKTVEALKLPLMADAKDVQAFRADVLDARNFNCDFSSILEALEMMVFAPPVEEGEKGGTALSGPGALMAGVQLAKFIKHGVDTIKTVDGKTLERDQVLTTVEQLDGRLFASAKDLYRTLSGEKYDIGGPGILATLDQWDKLIAQFIDLPSAAPLRHDIRELAEAVRVRGTAVADFNAALMDVMTYAELVADNDAKKVKLLAEAATLNDPALPAAMSFLARHHQARKDSLIELVYQANRAYANWMLDDGSARIPAKDGSSHGMNVFREVLVAKELWESANGDVYGAIDWAALDTCKAKLEEWFGNDIAAHSGVPQPFGSLASSGEQIIVDDKQVLAKFASLRPRGNRSVHVARIRITEDGADGTFTNEHLAGFANVRLTAFRVFLNGAYRKPGHADQRIQIELIHDSSDQYFTERGERRTFMRPLLEPRTFIYNGGKDIQRYARDQDGNTTDRFEDSYIHMDGLIGSAGSPGGHGLDESDAVYAGVGPFTEWTIVVDPALNPGLELGGLTSIEIQLVGVARTRL